MTLANSLQASSICEHDAAHLANSCPGTSPRLAALSKSSTKVATLARLPHQNLFLIPSRNYHWGLVLLLRCLGGHSQTHTLAFHGKSLLSLQLTTLLRPCTPHQEEGFEAFLWIRAFVGRNRGWKLWQRGFWTFVAVARIWALVGDQAVVGRDLGLRGDSAFLGGIRVFVGKIFVRIRAFVGRIPRLSWKGLWVFVKGLQAFLFLESISGFRGGSGRDLGFRGFGVSWERFVGLSWGGF